MDGEPTFAQIGHESGWSGNVGGVLRWNAPRRASIPGIDRALANVAVIHRTIKRVKRRVAGRLEKLEAMILFCNAEIRAGRGTKRSIREEESEWVRCPVYLAQAR